MDYLLLALHAAREAGAILRNRFRDPPKAQAKGPRDLVSDADRFAEERILEVLGRACPDIGWIAEESGRRTGQSDLCWCVDPLDGTHNFLMGIPYFSVSIALLRGTEVRAAVVHNPLLSEEYTAELGHGARLNGQSIGVSTCGRLEEALVACAFDAGESGTSSGLEYLGRLALGTRKTVVHFSPALDLCNVARGRLDGYVDNGTTPEDHAAASLILTEAGGRITNFGRAGWSPLEVGSVASNGLLHAALEAMAGGD